MIRVLYGDNDYALSQRYRREREAFEQQHGAGTFVVHDSESLSIQDLPQLLEGQSLFAPVQCHGIRDASRNKPLWEALGERLQKNSSTELLLVETKPDKRTRTWKWLTSHAEMIECKLLTERELSGWVAAHARQLRLELSGQTIRYLVERVGTDQWLLADALTKLSLGNQTVTRELIDVVIEPNPQANAFELLDAIMRQDQVIAMSRLEIIRRTEDPYKFMGLLISQFFALAACQAAGNRSSQQIAKDMGIHPFIVQKILPIARERSTLQLSMMIEDMDRCDQNLKSSNVEAWSIIELLVRRLSSQNSAM